MNNSHNGNHKVPAPAEESISPNESQVHVVMKNNHEEDIELVGGGGGGIKGQEEFKEEEEYEEDNGKIPDINFMGKEEHVVTNYAGGWQFFKVAVRGKTNWLETMYPRTYNICIKIILPLLFLIGLSFLCGYFLARAESGNEISTNDAILADFVDDVIKINTIQSGVKKSYDACLAEYANNTTNILTSSTSTSTSTSKEDHLVNLTDLTSFLESCTQPAVNETQTIADNFLENAFEQNYNDLSQNWITCRNETYARNAQSSYITTQWLESFFGLQAKYSSDGSNRTEEEATELARVEASTSEHCVVNPAAGGIFWFTVMSTIGYGNTAPTTVTGRALVFTLGFLSIICFTAVIGQAGYVLNVIADDFFNRFSLKRLTKGFTAVFFWLSMLILWMIFYTGIVIAYSHARYDGYNFPFGDGMWFSYITVTTVGFGDYHVAHDTFLPGDMFYIPLVNLLGFVILANFCLKLSDVLGKYISKGEDLLDMLVNLRDVVKKKEVKAVEMNGEERDVSIVDA